MLAALQKYLSNHRNDWDLNTHEFMYAYKFQSHTSTSLLTFELMLSTQPVPLTLKPIPSIEELRGVFKQFYQ